MLPLETDHSFAARLQALGLKFEDRNALMLVPVHCLAWADGDVDAKELAIIADKYCVAHSKENSHACIYTTRAGREFLNRNFVHASPGRELLDECLDLLRILLQANDPRDSARGRNFIKQACHEVAASGGILSHLFGGATKQKEALMHYVFKKLQIGGA